MNNKKITTPHFLLPAKFSSLNGIRAIAVLLVLFEHIFAFKNNITFHYGGEFGVTIFFVLSGFLITSLLLKEYVQKRNFFIRKFFINRALRILPISYLYLIIVAICNYFGIIKVPYISIVAPFFYVGNWFSLSYYTGHFWSLSLEEQFYIIFPLLLFYFKPQKYILFLLAFCFFILIIVYFSAHNNLFLQLFIKLTPLVKFIPIVTGSLCSFACFYYDFTHIKSGLVHKIILLVLCLVFYKWQLPLGINTFLLSASISLFIVVNIFQNEDLFYKFLNTKIINYIGLISYSLYVWQMPFCYHKFIWDKTFPFAVAFPINILLLFITSIISYEFIEKRFLKFKR